MMEENRILKCMIKLLEKSNEQLERENKQLRQDLKDRRFRKCDHCLKQCNFTFECMVCNTDICEQCSSYLLCKECENNPIKCHEIGCIEYKKKLICMECCQKKKNEIDEMFSNIY